MWVGHTFELPALGQNARLHVPDAAVCRRINIWRPSRAIHWHGLHEHERHHHSRQLGLSVSRKMKTFHIVTQ
jgi:hypothetical protein